MYAVIMTGGKQYRVTPGQKLKIEKLPQEVGQTISFEKVLLIADGADVQLGHPYISGAAVQAQITAQERHKKIRIIKLKRRKHHIKHMGHRQYYTEVLIDRIDAQAA